MGLPCICFKCARYKSLLCFQDEDCLAMEERGCVEEDCDVCGLTCGRFLKLMPETNTAKQQLADTNVH